MARGGNPMFQSKAFREQMRPEGNTTTSDQRTAEPMSSQSLQDLYNSPSASPVQTGRLTYNDVVSKTVLMWGTLVITAVVGWQMPALMLPAMLIGFVLALVNIFKREPSPVLIMLYAAAEGVFLGAISGVLDAMYDGIAVQAVLATFSVFAVTLLLYRSGKYRATPKMTKMFTIAMGAYLLFSLVNLGLMLFGVSDSMFGVRSEYPLLGVGIGILAVLLATYSLVLDFTQIQRGIEQGAPAKFAWTAAFGLTVTMVWLYIEILRIIAILRN
ncbi:MAG: Bax inhibitor-1/YccA family protein [Micrococcaceae bacterium]|uniref:Bax inhibitor-1/YccA family protein n=1 Tax=Arthrobacter sp. 179 TaxID=3457734 RepID=UPI0026535160|nr:Bax inhibitor-1/YccA family protein [Micrococcaceae bacterium]MDN5824471.1 Bax inhibitor-1/YccA family protein [Micrococcaceae bacterium]MDN5905021.1 Bax inhibitor-1/YccA family protein [Micrococcaceae bacterium]MDN6177015.1 Bax inhibitor-1/YccA family protein [Micrococcaceae bacterium]MDN6201781.1 Bax inhibitor-1/YccA family protein [Micrococcaceae bacterium]